MRGQDPQGAHLDPTTLARFIEGVVGPDEQTRCEAHLAECADCRAELTETSRILASRPRPARWNRLVPMAAAAAVLIAIWTGANRRPPAEPVSRDATLTTSGAPVPLTPVGRVARVDTLRWRAVPEGRRYRVTLFTGEGQVAWQTSTTDTFAVPADTLKLAATSPYYWQVKAETSYGRWVESELVGFTLVPAASSTRRP
jgi:hypothetical protein